MTRGEEEGNDPRREQRAEPVHLLLPGGGCLRARQKCRPICMVALQWWSGEALCSFL